MILSFKVRRESGVAATGFLWVYVPVAIDESVLPRSALGGRAGARLRCGCVDVAHLMHGFYLFPRALVAAAGRRINAAGGGLHPFFGPRRMLDLRTGRGAGNHIKSGLTATQKEGVEPTLEQMGLSYKEGDPRE